MRNSTRYQFAVMILVVTKLVITYVLGLYWVPTGSMEPTIKTGSLCLGWRLPYVMGDPQPHRGDIIIFKDPDTGVCYIKRVVGLPGDSISFVGGFTFVDDKQLNEGYLPEEGRTFADNDQSFNVPESSIYVLGDNRESSSDSRRRSDPYIPVADIQAKWLGSLVVLSQY